MKPIIGVVSGMDDESERYRTPKYYESAVEHAGGIPVMIPYVRDENIGEILGMIRGIIFSGGGDIHSKYYNEALDPRAASVVPVRDEFEISLFRKVIEIDMPCLGICRGNQLLNVALGGGLIQHISGHKGAKISPAHDVNITEGSLLHRIYKKNTLSVNSEHHQAVSSVLGENVIIAAATADGIIESIEVTGKSFILGVQWHPEVLVENYPEHLLVFEALVKSAEKYVQA